MRELKSKKIYHTKYNSIKSYNNWILYNELVFFRVGLKINCIFILNNDGYPNKEYHEVYNLEPYETIEFLLEALKLGPSMLILENSSEYFLGGNHRIYHTFPMASRFYTLNTLDRYGVNKNYKICKKA